MKILLHCDFDRDSVAANFGLSEYSYWFVHEAYRHVLEQFADTCVIRDLDQVDAIWAQCREQGERCVLLSFNPPHKTPTGLACPVVPVFAWEYPDLPRASDEACWNKDPRFDWAEVFRRASGAICLSKHSANAVRRRLGDNYPIAAIPTASWNPQAAAREAVAARGRLRELRVDAPVVDNRALGLNADGLFDPNHDDGTPFSPDDAALLPSHAPWAGDDWCPPMPSATQADDGEMMSEPVPCGWEIPPKLRIRTDLGRVVYTSVLTPADGRKNWMEIVSAFVWALRDAADATLVLKVGGADPVWHHCRLVDMLTRLSPFRCRVLAVHGMLDHEEYTRLIANTDFYVNASLCEGLCMPLMEYLSSGIPVIAPNHTAMADYLDGDNAFIVDSHDGEATVWSFGDMEIARTSRPRVNWHSLMQAFRSSYAMVTTDPAAWQAMSERAVESMSRYCADDACRAQLIDFLENLPLNVEHSMVMHA